MMKSRLTIAFVVALLVTSGCARSRELGTRTTEASVQTSPQQAENLQVTATGSVLGECDYNSPLAASIAAVVSSGRSSYFVGKVSRKAAALDKESSEVYTLFAVEMDRVILGIDPPSGLDLEAYSLGGSAGGIKTEINDAVSTSWAEDGRVFGVVTFEKPQGVSRPGPSLTTWPLTDDGVLFTSVACADNGTDLAGKGHAAVEAAYLYLNSEGEEDKGACTCLPVSIDEIQAGVGKYIDEINVAPSQTVVQPR